MPSDHDRGDALTPASDTAALPAPSANPAAYATPPDGGSPDVALVLPRWLLIACRALALLGGALLMAMMLMTVASVLRRGLFNAPIPGDFELVEFTSAMLIPCFLPWCQAVRGNVLVDIFTMRTGPRVNHALEAAGDLIYLLAVILLTWRLAHGAADFRNFNEQTMVLRLPVWTSFAVILPAFALLIVTIAFTLAAHLRAARA